MLIKVVNEIIHETQSVEINENLSETFMKFISNQVTEQAAWCMISGKVEPAHVAKTWLTALIFAIRANSLKLKIEK